MGNSRKDDVEFLKSYLQKAQEFHEGLGHIGPQDLGESDGTNEAIDDAERVAKLADKHGFDGNIFRDLFPLYPSRSGADFHTLEMRIYKQIETLPRIIAAVESAEKGADDKSAEPPAEPPADVLVTLGPKEAALFCELWEHGSVSFNHLYSTVWREPVQPATITQCAKRLQKRVLERGWVISTANKCVTLER